MKVQLGANFLFVDLRYEIELSLREVNKLKVFLTEKSVWCGGLCGAAVACTPPALV